MPSSHTAQHCGATMASVCSFVEEEYIDLDLSSCREFEFWVRWSGGAADELLCRGRLAAAPPRPGGKVQDVDAGSGGCGGAGRRSAATVAPLQHSHSAGFRDCVEAAQGGLPAQEGREDVASCQAAGVAGLLPVAVRLDVMLRRAMPRRQRRPAQGQGDAIWRRQEQLLKLQGAVRSNQERLPPGPGPGPPQ